MSAGELARRASVMLLGAILVGVIVPLQLGEAADTSTVVAIGTIIVCLAPLAWRVVHGSLDIFEPIVPASLMLMLLFGIRPLYDIAGGNLSYLGYDIRDEYGQAVLQAFLGTVVLVAAYSVAGAVGRQNPQPTDAGWRAPGQHVVTASVWVGAAAGVLGAALFVVYLATKGPVGDSLALLMAGRSASLYEGASTQYLSAAPLLGASAAVAIIAVAGPRLSIRHRILVGCLVLEAVLGFAFTGERRFIIPAVAAPIATYYLATRQRPRWFVLLGILPLAFVVLATVPYFRAAGAREQTSPTTLLGDAFARPFEAWDRAITGYDTEMVKAFAVEIGIIDDASQLYFGWATVGDLLIAPVPRALWAEKPTSARDDILRRAYGMGCTTTGGVCPDASAIGTFHQDFGLPGVLFGMGLLGLFSRRIWDRMMRGQVGPATVILVGTWSVMLPIMLRAGFAAGVLWWLMIVIPAVTVVLVSEVASQERVAQHASRRTAMSEGPT